MSLDRLSILFVLSLLPLLILPKAWLILGYVWAMVLFMVASVWRQKSGILLSLLVAFSYYQVIQRATQAEGVVASRYDEPIQIVNILKQQDYQTIIAQRENRQRIYLHWQTSTPLALGRVYQASFTLRPISSRQNIGNFDRQKWYFSQHIQAIGTVRYAQPLVTAPPSLRTQWLERTQQQLSAFRTKGLLLALAFGERAWLMPTDWQVFQQTATAHLIAISGLHIALAFGIGLGLAKGGGGLMAWLGRHRAGRTMPFYAKGIGFGLAVGYSYLAGFSVPTVRALLAMSVILLCQYLRRHYTPWQLWWRVVALLLFLDPLALLSDSFWLSVLAVASLILWYHHFPFPFKQPHFGKKSIFLSPLYRLAQLLHLQIGIGMVFLPVQLLFFEGVSPFALLANLIIVPWYSVLLVPLILFSLLTDNLFHTWWLADWLALASLHFLHWFSAAWQPLSLHQQWRLLSIVLVILLFLLMLMRMAWRSWKRWFWIGVVAMCATVAPWFWRQSVPQPLAQWLHFDVGQGLAMAFVYSTPKGRQAVLYDTGASWQGGTMAEIEILPYLQRQGIDIEAIFISHDDNDHAGGLPRILQQFPDARVIASGRYATEESCEKGRTWQFGNLHFSAIYPEKVVKRAKNADSCVLMVTIGQFKILLTGDAGRDQERQFSLGLGKVNFLQVGHHGSNTSSSHTLLATTQPDVAVISAGRWNPWKLPNRHVEQRLAHYHISTWNTARTGMVRIDFFADHYQIRTARHRWSPWYRNYFGTP